MFACAAKRFAKNLAIQNGKSISALVRPSLVSRPLLSTTNVLTPRYFSGDAGKKEVAYIEKPLKALDLAAVRQIKAELMEVDANFDGRSVIFLTRRLRLQILSSSDESHLLKPFFRIGSMLMSSNSF